MLLWRDSFPSEAMMRSTRTLEPSSMSSYQIVRFVHSLSGIFPATTEFAGHTAQNLPPTLHHAGQFMAKRVGPKCSGAWIRCQIRMRDLDGPVTTPSCCTFQAVLQSLERSVSKSTLLHWSIFKGITILPVPFHSYADRYQISRFMHRDGRLLR